MRLTMSLLKEIPYRYRGKYRIVPDPKFVDMLRLRHDLEREERNMLILRHPYLTTEQSFGHMAGRETKNLVGLSRDRRNAKYTKNITIEERLSHLKVTEGWD